MSKLVQYGSGPSSGCAITGSIMRILDCPSQNFDERSGGQAPSMIILHYTGTPTAEEAKERFCNASPDDTIGRIAPHYMIDGHAQVYKFMDETKRAWHAGRSSWQGITDINSTSIGIEIWNTGHEYDFEEFLPDQITALIGLIQDIRTRWPIADRYILGHSDVAPGRKLDPGEKFPWSVLAESGIGLMPKTDDKTVLPEDFYAGLARYGYTYTTDKEVLLKEFRRHFLPSRMNSGALGQDDYNALGSLLFQAGI